MKGEADIPKKVAEESTEVAEEFKEEKPSSLGEMAEKVDLKEAQNKLEEEIANMPKDKMESLKKNYDKVEIENITELDETDIMKIVEEAREKFNTKIERSAFIRSDRLSAPEKIAIIENKAQELMQTLNECQTTEELYKTWDDSYTYLNGFMSRQGTKGVTGSIRNEVEKIHEVVNKREKELENK